MKYTKIFSVALLGILAFIAGCKKEQNNETGGNPDTPDKATVTSPAIPVPEAPAEPKDPNEVVVSVDGKKYLRKDLDTMVDTILKARNVPKEHEAMARNQFEKQAAYSYIMKTLLLDEAKKQGIEVSAEDRAKQEEKIAEHLKSQNKTLEQYFKESPMGEERARQEFEDGLVIDKLLTANVMDKIEIDDAEIAEQIDEIKQSNKEIEEKNKNLEAVNAEKKAKIESLKKQLDEGADFAELAKANSDCPSGQKGGDLGSFTRGQMVPAFEQAAFSQEIGKVGDIVETRFGYHLIKVSDKSAAVEAQGDTPAKPETVTASHILIKTEQAGTPAPVPTAEDMKENLKQSQSRTEIQNYINGLKTNAVIETVIEGLPL